MSTAHRTKGSTVDPPLDVDALATALAVRTDEKVRDRYFFLLRIGSDWDEYPFNWEPFRDLAGPLQPSPTSMPVAMLSARGDLDEPSTSVSTEPFPHVEITVTRRIPVRRIVETWISALREQGVAPVSRTASWFLDALELTSSDVSAEVLAFLGIEPGRVEPDQRTAVEDLPLSGSMQAIRDRLAPAEHTAFDIAAAIADMHPEYAAERLGGAALTAPAGTQQRHSWPRWAASVSGLYDTSAVSHSSHEVLDGHLFLVGLGLLEPSLRAALDAAGVWTPLLLEVDDAVATAPSTVRSALEAVRFAHGFESDRTAGPDRLDIAGDVRALCDVITDPAVTPPLAVGLFGEWGAGKSFFMDKMRERIADLTTGTARRSELNVVQIRFNAWHYADTSLWASLAVEIFERLSDPEPVAVADRERWLRDRGDPGRVERTRLLAELETYRTAKAAIDVERERLVAERNAAEDRIEQAHRDREAAVVGFRFTDLAWEVAKNQQVKDAIARIADGLGFAPAASELAGLGRELRTTAGYLPAVWRKVSHKSATVVLIAMFVLLTAATASLVARADWGWLSSLATAGGSIAAVVVAVTRFLQPAARQVNAALADVESAITTATEVEAVVRSNRERDERILQHQLAALDRDIAEATQTVAALDQKIAETAAAADALAVGRRLYDFLTDRATGYQRHQGVVGMLHRDFRFLDAALRAYGASAERPANLPMIDRVVLYVDDLDRCPPAKVLEVLEAVHLLLALELFVVVVGVDPRWLQRSLRRQYRDLTSGEPDADTYLRAMPVEYLEKIFQIPLTLPAMNPRGYAKLIAGLAPSAAVSEPEALPAAPRTVLRTAAGPGSVGGDRAPSRVALEIQPGSSASDVAGGSIDLTANEVRFAQQLGPLIDSPRAAKRLMNTYRLIRATQHVGSRSRFLGRDRRPGEYQAVLTLLAVAAGYPTMTDRLLVALEDETTDIGNWPDFVAALRPGTGDDCGRLVPADLREPATDVARAEAATWANLHRSLASLPATVLPDLQPYRHWGPFVARFSFTL